MNRRKPRNQAQQHADIEAELAFPTSGFIVKVQGAWTAASLKQYRHFLSLRRLAPDEDELLAALQQAKRNFLEGNPRFYICRAQPCCTTAYMDLSDPSLEQLQEETRVAMVKTGCQGPCKQAPVITLRIGEKLEMFGAVTSENDWRAVLRFVKAAVQAGTLLVDTGEAEKFRIDPVHDHEKPSAQMKPLEFLLGRFRGEGRYAMNDYAFQKEVIGSFEASGRFIALRMDASYPARCRAQGPSQSICDCWRRTIWGYPAQAYTDGRIMREHFIEQHDGAGHPAGSREPVAAGAQGIAAN